MKKILAIAFLFSLATSCYSQDKNHLLIIGVSEYEDSQLSDLANPVLDANRLHNVLTSDYCFDSENVTLQENPVYKDIINYFDSIARILSDHENLLIFYAGKGAFDEEHREGYWLPSDAVHKDIDKWISVNTILEYIAKIDTRHTLLIVDASYSGSIFKTRSAMQAEKNSSELRSRKAITSTNLSESPDHSVFTEYLIRSLSRNRNPQLSSQELFMNIRSVVMNNSNNIPLYGSIGCGDEGGDFIFHKR